MPPKKSAIVHFFRSLFKRRMKRAFRKYEMSILVLSTPEELRNVLSCSFGLLASSNLRLTLGVRELNSRHFEGSSLSEKHLNAIEVKFLEGFFNLLAFGIRGQKELSFLVSTLKGRGSE